MNDCSNKKLDLEEIRSKYKSSLKKKYYYFLYSCILIITIPFSLIGIGIFAIYNKFRYGKVYDLPVEIEESIKNHNNSIDQGFSLNDKLDKFPSDLRSIIQSRLRNGDSCSDSTNPPVSLYPKKAKRDRIADSRLKEALSNREKGLSEVNKKTGLLSESAGEFVAFTRQLPGVTSNPIRTPVRRNIDDSERKKKNNQIREKYGLNKPSGPLIGNISSDRALVSRFKKFLS